jgi:hypothetical protein
LCLCLVQYCKILGLRYLLDLGSSSSSSSTVKSKQYLVVLPTFCDPDYQTQRCQELRLGLLFFAISRQSTYKPLNIILRRLLHDLRIFLQQCSLANNLLLFIMLCNQKSKAPTRQWSLFVGSSLLRCQPKMGQSLLFQSPLQKHYFSIVA